MHIRQSVVNLAVSLMLTLYSFAANAATITVTSLVGAPPSSGDCTLREAIIAANTDAIEDACGAGNGADTIIFSVSGATFLADELPEITESLTISGLGIANTIIDGEDSFRHFIFNTSGDDGIFALNNMTLTHAASDNGGSIRVLPGEELTLTQMVIKDNTASGSGGGVYLENTTSLKPTTLTVRFSTISGNAAQGSGAPGGGGIRAGSASIVTISDSTLSGNQATNASGGGIYSFTNLGLIIQRSTIANNAAARSGGGVMLSTETFSQASVTINHSSITGNTADGDNMIARDVGGGIAMFGTHLSISNTVVAGNIGKSGALSDIKVLQGSKSVPSTLNTNGYNFIGNNEGVEAQLPAGNPNANQDIVGTLAVPLNPGLAALADNGGVTLTRAPANNASAVVDKGKCAGETTDQRGYGAPSGTTRVFDDSSVANAVGGDGCDIGAVEFVPAPDTSMCFPIKATNNKLAVICL